EHEESGAAALPDLLLLGGELSTPEHRQDRVGTGGDSTGVVALAEVRGDHVVNDQEGLRVREHAFEAIAYLDAHVSLARVHDEQHAVVLALLADAPVAPQLVAVLLYGVAREGWQ